MFRSSLPPPLRHAFGRVTLAIVVLLVVVTWQEYSIRRARAVEIGSIRADFRKWVASNDSLAKIRLQTDLETRMDPLEHPEELVTTLPPELLDNILGTKMLSNWAGQDRRAALAWLSKQPMASEHQLGVVLDHWILDAPIEAESYFQSLPSGTWKSRVLNYLSTEAIQHGFPQRGLSLIEKMPENEIPGMLLNLAVREWARRDKESLQNWIERRPDARERGVLRAEMNQTFTARSSNDE